MDAFFSRLAPSKDLLRYSEDIMQDGGKKRWWASYVVTERKNSCVEESRVSNNYVFLYGATVHYGPGPPYYRGFKITLRHATLGRTLLNE
jgi:hypothetical protein